jgi:multiple sugar transport system ATP-binding protein
MNFVKGEVKAKDRVDSPLGAMAVTVPDGLAAGTRVTLAIRPEHVKVSPVGSHGVATRVGKITSKNYLGDAALLEVELNGVTLLAKLSGDSDLGLGQTAVVELPAQRWHVFG